MFLERSPLAATVAGRRTSACSLRPGNHSEGQHGAGGTGHQQEAHVAEDDGHRALAIVYVDDHEDSRRMAGEMLAHHGWNVRIYASGEVALREIRRHPPDIVVTDLNMGGFGGFALVRALRADPRTAT